MSKSNKLPDKASIPPKIRLPILLFSTVSVLPSTNSSSLLSSSPDAKDLLDSDAFAELPIAPPTAPIPNAPSKNFAIVPPAA